MTSATDSSNFQGSGSADTLTVTPRRERLEGSIARVLRAGGTRSALRTSVTELADYLRTRGMPLSEASDIIREIGLRAAPYMPAESDAAVGDSASDRIPMMLRWTTTFYTRAD